MNIKKTIRVMALCGVMVLSGLGVRVEAAGYRMPISFAGYTNQAETLTDFPVLVVLSNNVGGSAFDYSHFLSPAGWDLRFRDAGDTTDLNYEIESWNTNGASHVWVRVPELAGDGATAILAKWGDSDQSTQLDCTTNGAVWNAGYKGVWHFPDGVTLGGGDATTNRNNGGLSNGVSAASGNIDGAAGFDGANDYVDIGRQLLSGSDNFTISLWMKSGGSQNTYACPISQGHGNGGCSGVVLQYGWPSATNLALAYGDGSGWRSVGFGYNLAADTAWHFITATKSGSTMTTFKDGIPVAQNSSYTLVYGTYNLNIGRDYFNTDSNHRTFKGLIDEVRVSSVAHSSNWVWACYQNTASNTAFNSYGTVEPPRKGPVVFMD